MARYRAGIVGLTGIGSMPLPTTPVHPALGIELPHNHAGAYALTPSTEVVAVCELKVELLEKFKTDFAETWPDARTYTNYREMLDKERLDLLSVVTSDHRHAQIVVDAAERGVRGIACEKPLATTMADAERMIEACERNGVVMTVDHSRRLRPHWHAALAQLGDGGLGAVRRVVGSGGGPRAMLFRNGTHLIDAVCWFAGGEPELVVGMLDEEHQEYGPRYAGDGGRDPALDPGGSALVRFDNGVRAFISFSKRTTTTIALEVFAEKGVLRVDDVSAQVFAASGEGRFLSGRTVPAPLTQTADIPALITDLIGAMEQGRQPLAPPREARKALAIILGLLQSQAAGHASIHAPITDV